MKLSQTAVQCILLSVLIIGNYLIASKPNIIYINVDDLDFDEISVYDYREFPSYTGMRAAGYFMADVPLPIVQNLHSLMDDETLGFEDPRMLTPNVEKLADQGTIFTRFYVTSAACTPSRYTSLTGRLASRSPGLLATIPQDQQVNIRWNTSIAPEEPTLIKSLDALGYTTGISGKWHNGISESAAHAIANEMDVEYPFDVEASANIHDSEVQRRVRANNTLLTRYLEEYIGFDWARTVSNKNKEFWPVPETLKVHNLEWITGGALDFIDAVHGEPFFLYVSMPVPHGHYYKGWEQSDVRATPGGFWDQEEDAQLSRDSIFERLQALGIDERSSMGTWIDDSVGAILERLDAYGLAENTIVIFTSDHQARGKNTCYEGARVPFIIRWPGVTRPGSQIDALCVNADLAPTFVEVAGGSSQMGAMLDGMSLLPLIRGERRDQHPYVFLELNNSRALVSERWKLLLNRVPEYQKVVNPQVWEREPESIASAMAFERVNYGDNLLRRRVAWDGVIGNGIWENVGVWFYSAYTFPAYFEPDQLYDLSEDPFEQHNLIHEPAVQSTVVDLKSKMAEVIRELPRPFGEFESNVN
ncbi:sulfatase-like hydrolase/transferase [Coraliomargarita sp. SDUM461004]|uniref:Sulfatase-like hydrolase/transferase n=1 Tax=Thalassobacterium sedimentorum TaxID=3041258 RepID=A0ABU1AH32_9BACT|nr:sulfatase-like hydrolase/transferase [Coraliomargarita sp. SDUM461004]MDQ8194117.1 sulfatase-like hydrolase/transferase [Coraliomargarita sp. SDUM461004]